MANIDINQLTPGMVIIKITAQNGPVKIRKSGLVSSQEMVLGLMEMGVQQLEIDPAQTVELGSSSNLSSIQSVSIPSSPMQSLLMKTQQGRHQSIDNSISEQFNRSLFLPSITALPSVWQYYGQRVLMVLIVLAGGAGLGWTAATVDQWSSIFTTTAPVLSQPMVINQPSALGRQGEGAAVQITSAPVTSIEPLLTENAKPQLASQPDNAATDIESPIDNEKNSIPQISPELLKKFSQAVAEVGIDKKQTKPVVPVEEKLDVPRIDQLPAWVLKELPKMSFSAHMYASEPQDRWVKLNGVKLHEGEWINPNLQLERIISQKVILNYKGQQFSMNALTDW